MAFGKKRKRGKSPNSYILIMYILVTERKREARTCNHEKAPGPSQEPVKCQCCFVRSGSCSQLEIYQTYTAIKCADRCFPCGIEGGNCDSLTGSGTWSSFAEQGVRRLHLYDGNLVFSSGEYTNATK